MHASGISYAYDRLVIRSLREQDLSLIKDWRNHESVRSWFLHSNIISDADQARFFDSYQKRTNDHMFVAALHNEPQTLVGSASLYHLHNGTGEFGRLMIDPARSGQGLGYELTQAICRLGKEVLHLDSIYLEVFADNIAARHIYEKCGFQITESVLHEGRRVVRMELPIGREEV